MLSVWQNAGVFLIRISFDLYLFMLTLRFFLQWTEVNYYNSLTQFVIKLTWPVVYPLQKVLPTVQRVDFAVIVAILAFQGLELYLVCLFQGLLLPNPVGIAIWGIGEISQQVISLFFYAILLQSILSWVRTPNNGAILEVLFRLTAPMMYPVRRLVPAMSGIDITPIPVLIILKLLEIVISIPLLEYGRAIVVAS